MQHLKSHLSQWRAMAKRLEQQISKRPVLLWFICGLFVSFIFFCRFPNSFFYPNFYAEDGTMFTQAVLQNGIWPTILTPFNGYQISGLYLLTAAAVFLNAALFNHLLFLPTVTATVSYLFFGFALTLPILFFGSSRKRFIIISLYTLYVAFVPLPNWDYAIIGTIGNTKFLFSSIAVFCILALTVLQPKLPIRMALYLGILLSAYTNPTVYPLFLFLVWPYAKNIITALIPRTPKTQTHLHALRSALRQMISDKRFWEFCLVGVILSLQVLWIWAHGIPEQPGYLDEPFEWSKGVEVIFARSLLFPFVLPLYTSLHTTATILLSGFGIIALYALGRREHWPSYTFLLGSIFIMTGLLILTRPGISAFFDSYSMPAGPGQFFYPQNVVAIFLFFFWLNDLFHRFQISRFFIRVIKVLALGWLVVMIPLTGSFGSNNFMQERGTFMDQAKTLCSSQQALTHDDATLQVPIYPSEGWVFTTQEHALCNKRILDNHSPETEAYGLVPAGAYIESGVNANVTVQQTILSPYNDLNAVSLYFSTFKKTPSAGYRFELRDEHCTEVLRTTTLNSKKIRDNAFHEISFDPLPDSKGKNYCFTVRTDNPAPPAPVTLQISKPDVYTSGALLLNGAQRNDDLVFKLHFNQRYPRFLKDRMQ